MLFGQVRSFFCQVGSFILQYLRRQVSGSPLESRRPDSTASPLPLFSAKFKIAVALSAAGDRYLPQCAAEVHYPHQHLFKLMKGGAATAGTGGRHVSHWIEIIESLSLTLSWLDLAETTNTSLELGSEAYCTICSASTLIEGQNRCSKDDRQCW